MKKRKLNKKRIAMLILLICLIILQIKAFTDSQANKILEITLAAKDNKAILEDSLVVIEAIDEGESGYSFILPEIVNEKRVSKYYITVKSIESEEEISNEVEKIPGEKIYLTEEEIQSGQIEVKAEYDSITEEENVFYYEIKQVELEDGRIVTLEGYIENGTTLKVENVLRENITQIDNILGEYNFYTALDISLEKENVEKDKLLER